jgi:tRNA A37 threonylcarbamoyladenosine dehydratase
MEIPTWLERTELLIGTENLEKLDRAHVLLVGLGGVGSFAGEFLVRAGVGHLTIIDGDIIDITNINRQLQATHSTIGTSKSKVLVERFKDINPKLDITYFENFLEPADMSILLNQQKFDFILDCIDSLTPKLSLLKAASTSGIQIISSMGAGGKLDPSKIRIADISDTKECKFAHAVRKRLRKEGVKNGVLTVYSEEIQQKHALQYTDGAHYKRSFYGTISYMPALFGLTMAAEVIRRLIGVET